MTKLLCNISFLFCNLLMTQHIAAQEIQVPSENQTKQEHAFFDETLFDIVTSGLSRIDLTQLHTELVAIQPTLLSYPTLQQAFYWYNLAVCSRQLVLPSDQVLPYIKKALNLLPEISKQQQFKILTKAIDLVGDYQHYELLIAYIEQLREFTKDELDPSTRRLPEEYENLKARALYQTGKLAEAEVALNLLIDEAQQNNSPHNVSWYALLSSIHHINKNREKEVYVLRKQLELFPSANRQQYLVSLLKSEVNQN